MPFQQRNPFPSQQQASFDNRDADNKSLGGRSRDSQPQTIQSPTMSGGAPNNPNISIHDNKREYLKEKERKDLEELEAELKREKAKLA